MYKGFQSEDQMGRKNMSTKWGNILSSFAFEFNCRIEKTNILRGRSTLYIYVLYILYIYKPSIKTHEYNRHKNYLKVFRSQRPDHLMEVRRIKGKRLLSFAQCIEIGKYKFPVDCGNPQCVGE